LAEDAAADDLAEDAAADDLAEDAAADDLAEDAAADDMAEDATDQDLHDQPQAEQQIQTDYTDPKQAMKAYNGTFSETPAISELWKEAASTQSKYDGARTEFWRLVNNGASENAKQVQQLLKTAGYELQGGSNAPKLKLDEYELLSSDDAGKRDSDLTLSIDHIRPQSGSPELALNPENLRFMTKRDNSTLGAWNKGRDPSEFDKGRTFTKPLSQADQEAFRQRVEEMGRKKYGWKQDE
jgi:hypothetical protein